jgi:maltose O-acetyltransferase
LLSMVGCDVRRGTSIFGHVTLVGPRDAARRLQIGPGSVIGPHVTFCLDAPITLGRNVSLGPYVMLYTAGHSLGVGERRMQFDVVARPIVVEDGAWIGLGSVVLPGVRVGRGAVISAGSVVSKDVPQHALVAGNPAEVVEQLPER